MGAADCKCAKDPGGCHEDSLTLFHCAALGESSGGHGCLVQEEEEDPESHEQHRHELTGLSDRPFSPTGGGFSRDDRVPGGFLVQKSPRDKSQKVHLPGGAVYEGSWLEPGGGSEPPASGPSLLAAPRHRPVKHGHGTLLLPDGMRYCGQFQYDRKSGYGTLSYPSGCSYGGQWAEDLQNGHGTETWADGSHFEGSFKAGEKHGKGRFLWGNGCFYEGEFEHNDMHGEGAYTWSDGRMYSGQWTRNFMSPLGTMQWPDGRVYAGNFQEGRKHGEGTHWWPDGRSYRGQWQLGKQHGVGLARTVKGVECKGRWDDGKFIEWLDECEEAGSGSETAPATLAAAGLAAAARPDPYADIAVENKHV